MLLDRMNVLSSEDFSVAHGRFSYDEHGAKMTATAAKLTVTYAAHGLAENDVITIKSAIHNSNNGEFKVDAVTSSSEFVITGASQDVPRAFTANQTRGCAGPKIPIWRDGTTRCRASIAASYRLPKKRWVRQRAPN
jgi:hypothetical protein